MTNLHRVGSIGTAQQVDLTRYQAMTCLTAWFLHLPAAHPIWPRYSLGVIHLRDVPGVLAADKDSPEATHELMVAALEPDPIPTPEKPRDWRLLTPFNVVQQVSGLTDPQAMALAEWVVGEVVAGRLWVEPSDIRGERERWQQTLTQRAAVIGLGTSI